MRNFLLATVITGVCVGAQLFFSPIQIGDIFGDSFNRGQVGQIGDCPRKSGTSGHPINTPMARCSARVSSPFHGNPDLYLTSHQLLSQSQRDKMACLPFPLLSFRFMYTSLTHTCILLTHTYILLLHTYIFLLHTYIIYNRCIH